MLRRFPAIPEFDLVESLLQASSGSSKGMPENWVAAGDDCALWDQWAITKDLSVEGTHFRLDWSTPLQAARKCLVSNISDLQAMGARPSFALLGLCLNRHWPNPTGIAESIGQAFAEFQIPLLGGDTVVGDLGMFSITLVGARPEFPLFRSGARAGQGLFVTGKLGASAAGLALLQKMDGIPSGPWSAELIRWHLDPNPQLNLGARLVEAGVRGGGLDLSDGLSSEVHHLALSSGVALRIYEKDMPVHQGVMNALGGDLRQARPYWLHGGEDYGLLFTSDEGLPILTELADAGLIHRIGDVLQGEGVHLVNCSGSLETIRPGAWSHL